MEIIKYAGKSCVKCMLLDKLLNTMKLDVVSKYVEDEGEDVFVSQGITNLPSLVIMNNEKKVVLSNIITQAMIENAIKEVSE